MPDSSDKSPNTTGGGDGCCSPDNGCASTIGNPRRAPYKNKQGELICSCGCEKSSQDCTDCFKDLCEGKYLADNNITILIIIIMNIIEFLLNPPV
jgi:hypothetical protein